jgi:SAM-dependent methyltransferase
MTTTADPDALKAYSFTLFSKLDGALTSVMVHLGDRLGLYRALADLDRPVTSAELAEATGLHERWLREWLCNQGAAKLLAWDEDGRFWMTPEAVAVLANPDHPAFGLGMFGRLPTTIGLADRVAESFKTGIGYDYDTGGPDAAAGIERSFAPWYKNFLVPVALPAMDDVVAKLEAGAVAADIGCGAGVAVLTLAKAFPKSEFHGYDISQHALERAEAKRAEAGLANAHFHQARTDPLPDDHSVDLVTMFDCLHDMSHPAAAVAATRAAIKPDGTWLLVDIKGRDTFAQNVQKNPMASMMYATSIMSCMASALSEPGGAGLGTLGLPESRAREFAEAEGFTRFRKLSIDHPVNAFYEIRP